MTPTHLVFVSCLNREAPYFQGARGEGLAVFAFNEDTLELGELSRTTSIDNPTYFSLSPDGTHLYVNWEVHGWHEGLISALRFDRQSPALVPINTQPALGSITAHNLVSRDGRYLLVANYAFGAAGPDQSVVVFGIKDDGGITPALASAKHSGTGPNEDRQERPHAHSVLETQKGRIVFVADLGIDRIMSYRLGEDGQLSKLHETATAPGAGPRHMALHPSGKTLFVINELAATIGAYRIEDDFGVLSEINTIPTIPTDAPETQSSDLQLSEDGSFVYGANRGHDSIVVMAVDPATHALSLVEYVSCAGKTPRNLALTPGGRHLFCANQNSDEVIILQRDEESGRLTHAGASISIGTPMCVQIVPW